MCRMETCFADSTSFVQFGPGHARASHYDLDLVVDFEHSKLVGSVSVTCEGAGCLILDTRDLKIGGVFLKNLNGSRTPLPFLVDISQKDPTMGVPVVVTLGDVAHSVVIVEYETSPNSSALQWLTPEQTTSKKFPFLFSQCQAIHARSMLPCQDVCQVKATYTAKVACPKGLTVLMSAQQLAANSNTSTFEFSQTVPIPPYLIAIVCGELETRALGARSAVWAEPAVVEKAAAEFEDTEQLIAIAEDLCGPYRFGRFDLLVLPPSFPYGGMENPCLTFVTPTLLAGDKSQVAVIAHELAHSWSGNLATNASWEDFWLNEGLTVFTEKKIVQRMFGSDAAHIRGQDGWDHLAQYVAEVGPEHEYTKLCPRINRGEDPDDSFSVVPYEKGASLFWCLEALVGPSKFEPFIIDYFNEFAFKSVSSEQFRHFVLARFPAINFDWKTWFHAPGMPSYKPPVDPAAIAEAHQLALSWAGETEPLPCDVALWSSGKKCVFINALTEAHRADPSCISPLKIQRMVDQYQFLSTNCQVRCGFIVLMLRVAPDLGTPYAVKLATEQGRMKYTRPMYKELFCVNPQLARATFVQHRNGYHPICAKMVARDLGLNV